MPDTQGQPPPPLPPASRTKWGCMVIPLIAGALWAAALFLVYLYLTEGR